MIGGKSHGIQKPTALGTMLQASTYGMTKPSIYGRCRSPLIAIWAQDLREGDSGKKGKKKEKKGAPPTYVERIDFLVGSNPILGPLQAWTNQREKLPLNFLRIPFTGPPYAFSYTFTDPYFYFVIGVTFEIENFGAFDDYGSPGEGSGGIGNMAVSVGGTGYAPGDTFSVNGGSPANSAIGVVTAIMGLGAAASAIAIVDQGTGYPAGGARATTTLTGGGSGLLVDIRAVGSIGYDDTSELPAVNVAQHGPDLVDGNLHKRYPWRYLWRPGSNVITFPDGNYPFIGRNIRGWFLYYAQLSAEIDHATPFAKLRLTFESELANGPEYGSRFASQQRIMPWDAGAGSPNIDLGSAAAIPSIRPEWMGSYSVYPTGDADFPDIIEEVIKSGQIQVGTKVGELQRGANCNELPGPVQKNFQQNLEMPVSDLLLTQPVKAGSILVAMSHARLGSGVASILDAPGASTWNEVFSADSQGVWWAQAAADIPADDLVSFAFGGGGGYNNDEYLFVMDPDTDTVEDVQTQTGLLDSPDVSISTAGPSFLVGFLINNVGLCPVPPLWSDMFPNAIPTWTRVFYRRVTAGGTYRLKMPGVTGNWSLVLMALTQSQVPKYPRTLGRILDQPSLDLVRRQCRAYGLYGSLSMQSQKKGAEWLDELGTCANLAYVWSGFRLKTIPRAEASCVGNGTVYISPTASGPVLDIPEDWLIGDGKNPPVTIEHSAPNPTADNILQIQHFDRANDYNPATTSEPDAGALALFGPRKAGPQLLEEIQDPAIARKILRVQVQRKVHIEPTVIRFKMQPRSLPEAMDLVSLNDSILGLKKWPVRLTSVTEQEDSSLECEAEPFVWGASSPFIYGLGQAPAANSGLGAGNGTNTRQVPASINPPIIFEPVPRLYQNQNERQLWLGVSDPDPVYGGSVVWLSTDGGTKYNAVGTIVGNAATGVSMADWPAATSPDSTNDLPLDLTESLGELPQFSADEEDDFLAPSLIAGGTACIPYELLTYAVAQLTAANQYTLKATGGNHLNRAVFGAPNAGGVGVLHPLGSRFLFLDPLGTGLLKLVMDAQWIGVTLWFKFTAFNKFMGGMQNLADVTPYSFTPLGCAGAVNPSGVPPTLWQVNGS